MMTSEGGSGSQDFDLNLAPIIDCFTVLITYLLVSASFISLSIFDVGVSASGEAAPGAEPQIPPLSMILSLKESKGIDLKVTGGPDKVDLTYPIAPNRNSYWDIEAINKKFGEMQKKWKLPGEATISAEPKVEYKDVIKVIEALKKTIPKIFLAG